MLCTPDESYSPQVYCLPSGVVDLSEEISIIILGGITVLSQPQGEDEVVPGEEHGEESEVINTEPLVGTLGGEGGRRAEDSRHESSGNGGDGLHRLGLRDGREGGLGNIGCRAEIW